MGWVRMGEIQGRISMGQAGVHCEEEEEEQEEVRGFLRNEAIFAEGGQRASGNGSSICPSLSVEKLT